MADLLNYNKQNSNIQQAILKSINNVFPVTAGDRTLEIANLKIVDNLSSDDFPKQKELKINRRSWQIPLYADILLKDSTGKVINQKKNAKIGNIPKLTNRFTTIIEGNEYQTVNQLRRKPGIYARIKKNGELENEFNLEKGLNFKMQLDPISEKFVVIFDNRKYRLWTLLNLLGVGDEAMRKVWGTKLLEVNKKNALNTEISEMTSIFTKIYHRDPKDYSEVLTKLKDYFENFTKVDPNTTLLTLGRKHSNVNGQALLDSSKKLLDINKGTAEPDDRDSLVFKQILSVDDLLINHFDKQKDSLTKKLRSSMMFKDQVREIVSAGTFSKPIKLFFTTGDLSSTPPQTNPVAIVSEWRKTSPMGTGGIKSKHSITEETRDVQPTHLGFIDSTASPEGSKIGVTLGMTSEVVKEGNELKSPVYNTSGKLVYISPLEFFESYVVYPDQYEISGSTITPKFKSIHAMYKGELIRIAPSKANYYIRSPRSMFSFAANAIPFLDAVQGNRSATGARMMTQAMALDNKEAPLVQTYRDKDSTYEKILGNFLNPVYGPNLKGKPRTGTVSKITKDYIYIIGKDGSKTKKGLYNNFPLNQDGYLDSTPLVNVGDEVNSKTILAENNYSSGDTLSIGKNLTTAYMTYKGYNYEDGAVITESAANKLSHSMLHKVNVFFTPKLSAFSLEKFSAWYPDAITPDNRKKLDSSGIIKVGETVNPEDVLIAFLVKREMDDHEVALHKLSKYTFGQFNKNLTEWSEDEPGVVTDVVKTGRNIDIYVKSTHPFKEGDKLSGRYGNKSIVTKIIPDADAPHREDGTPIDIMLNAHGVPSRMNIGQILETAAGKIAKKTGKPYIVKNFNNPEGDRSAEVLAEMKELGIEPDETLTDGKTGKAFDNQIFVGQQYFFKLRHIVNKKLGAHGIGQYDIDEQPVGKGSQHVGILDNYAYLAHGAKANLRDIGEIKGRSNDEYWRDLQLGLPPSKPSRNFVFEKLTTYIQGLGVNVTKKGNKLQILPLTDKDVTKLSNGALEKPGTMLVGKNLMTRAGGLFDEKITGGISGTLWSHINLATNLPNPMFAPAITKILGITDKKYSDIIDGKLKLKGKSGIPAIISALEAYDVDAELVKATAALKTAPVSSVNSLNTKVRYLQNLSRMKLNPKEAYTITKIPILPPKFRPIYSLPTGDLMTSDINKHYRDIGVINTALKSTKDIIGADEVLRANRSLYDSVRAMQGFIEPITYGGEKYKGILEEIGESKKGLIQGKSWGKRQDLSARSTIIVDPDLGLNEVGTPFKIAYSIYKPFIIKNLKEFGLKATAAVREYKDETDLAKSALVDEMKRRPVIMNRAPTLHKHGVQAFKPQLVDGKSIRMNPLVMRGFNADFDGDTMSVMVPVSAESVEEAKNMMPSKILFKHGDNSIVPEISKEYVFGIHQLSLIKEKSKESFKSISDAKKAKIPWTTQFDLNGTKVTIGQFYINSELPEKLRDYERVLTAKVSEKLLTTIATTYPNYFTDVINSWKSLGAMQATLHGNTLSLNDFVIDRAYRDDLLKEKLPAINKLKGQTRIDSLNKLTIEVQKAQDKSVRGRNNIYDMLDSGSFGKTDSVRQILSMPGVLMDTKGRPIPYPVLKSYGEGLDTPSYFASLYGVRKGNIDRSVNTEQSGALNKALLNINRRLLITVEDCNTRKGLEIGVNDKNVIDRMLLNSVSGVGKRNDIVDSNVLLRAKKDKLKTLWVRSPLTCEAVEGICQACYGLMPNGKLSVLGEAVGVLDGQAITERSTQLVMQTFHTGGTALGGGGGGAVTGFPRLKQLFFVPQKLSGKATLSTVKGTIKSIKKNLTGGYSVRIEGYGEKNDKTFTIPSGRLPIVTEGVKIGIGDAISDGIIKPQELGELKDHLSAQKYLVEEASKVYGGKFFNKTFETVIRGISDNAQITVAPEGSGFLRGDRTTISYLNALNKDRKKEKLPLIEYDAYFKSIDSLNADSDDWLTRVSANRVKRGLTVGAAKGLWANIRGKDPVPAFIYGDNFGKNTNYQKGEFF